MESHSPWLALLMSLLIVHIVTHDALLIVLKNLFLYASFYRLYQVLVEQLSSLLEDNNMYVIIVFIYIYIFMSGLSFHFIPSQFSRSPYMPKHCL